MTRFTAIARTSVLIAIASSALALSPTAFAAADDSQAPQAQLDATKTDFTSLKSLDHLKSRLRRVAFDICIANGDRLALLRPEERKCIDSAIAGGMAQIDSKRELALRHSAVNVASAQTEAHPAH